MLSVKESAKFIAEHAEHVSISGECIAKFAKSYVNKPATFEHFKPFSAACKLTADQQVDFLFVINSLNFCFWLDETEDSRTDRNYEVNGKKGYEAFCEALNKAVAAGFRIYEPAFYSTITYDCLVNLLKDDSSSLLKERHSILHENGHILISKYNGSFRNCVSECGGSAMCLLELVVRNFPTFRDQGTYKNREVAFYKRAQILVADLTLIDAGPKFGDIDKLTMFADYRVPQSLQLLGILQYSDHLTQFIRCTVLNDSHDLEMEIRGCSIHAVELLVSEIKKIAPDVPVNGVLLDYVLWNLRRSNADRILTENIPYHKRITIFY